MNNKFFFLSFLVLLAIGWFSCNSDYTPKPRGYFTIELPQRSYRLFDSSNFPYAFEYPNYAIITSANDSSGNDDYWINVEFPRFNSRIYLSYKSIGGNSVYKISTPSGYKDSIVPNRFESLREEAYKLTYKHTIKANSIVDSLFTNPQGSSGVYFYVAGEAATSKQFYLTDTTRHFLRGALYFDASPNADSLSQVANFLEEDIRHIIKTLRWK
jgi:gliding motility-associated lipoprotein GldD